MFVFNNKVQHMFFVVDVVVDKVQPMVGWLDLHCIVPLNYIDSIFKG